MDKGVLGDLKVNRVGFGAKRLLPAGFTAADREGAVRLLRRAVELGVDHIDTAAFYPSVANDEGPTGFTSLDVANELIGEALAPYDEGLVIATKVGPTRDGLARPDQLRALVEADLRALRRGPAGPGLPAPGRTGVGGRALRRPRRAPRRGAGPSSRPLQRQGRAPRAGSGDRARRGDLEPLRARLR